MASDARRITPILMEWGDQMKRKADAMPTKEFFVRMITRDISLEDCLLDLIDNCLDGARRQLATKNGSDSIIEDYDGFRADLHIGPNEFSIDDNCGGISIANAIDYAFHFGRRPDAPDEGDHAIGLYGIGMKRAMLKIGKNIAIHSSTENEAFVCTIDVEDWLSHDEWEFDMEDADQVAGTGTKIRITDINKGIAEEFDDSTFVNSLSRIVSRDYALFLDKGFSISINGNPLEGYGYAVKESDEFKSYRKSYEDGNVRVEVIAGMAAAPPSDLEPSDRPETSYYGWFIVCNDRVVLPADKSERTVWGDERFPHWHYQYNGLMGMVLFHARDPNLLPWTTTKRDVDESSPLYRRAVNEMKKATRPSIEYTNRRKANLEESRAKERMAKTVSFFKVEENPVLKVPVPPEKPKIRMANILYTKPLSEVDKVRKSLGKGNMSYRAVGEKTFDYFVEHEVEE